MYYVVAIPKTDAHSWPVVVAVVARSDVDHLTTHTTPHHDSHENKILEKHQSRGGATTPTGTEAVLGCRLQNLCTSLAPQPVRLRARHF